MHDDLMTGLPALLAVAQRKSFTAAAAQLGVSASAVSQKIRQLEERLGARLLHRTTRSVGLTEAGARFVERIGPALTELDAAAEDLTADQARPTGTLRLNTSRFAWDLVMAPIFAGLMREHPELRMEVVVTDALADIVADGFDAGLRLGETLDPDMVAVRVSPDLRMAVVGAPSYLAAHTPPRHPRDLQAHDCIRYRRHSRGTIEKWWFVDRRREVEVEVDGRLVTDDGRLLVDAAVAGIGLGYLMEDQVAAQLSRGQLVRVLERFCPPFPGLHLYYPNRQHLPKRLQVVIDRLRARLSPPPAKRPRA